MSQVSIQPKTASEFAVLPNSWKVLPLSELASKFKAGGTPKRGTPEYWNGDIPFALIEDITSTDLYLSTTKEYISEEGLKNSSAWMVPADSLLITMYGTIGSTAINRVPLATNQAILAMTPSDEFDPLFGAYLIRHESRRLARQNVQSTQKNVSKTILSSFDVAVPPLPEQRAIAYVLRTVQEAKEKTEAVIQATAGLKKSLIGYLLKFGPVRMNQVNNVSRQETDIGHFPQDWQIVELKDVLRDKIRNGAFIKQDNFGRGIPFLNVADIYKKTSADLKSVEQVEPPADEFEKFSIKPNDIFYVRSSLTREGVGHCCIVETVPEPSIFDCHLMRVRVVDDKIKPKFLAYYSLSRNGKRALIQRSKTTTMTTINQNGLAKFKIPVPNIDEQNEIISMLESVEYKIQAEQDRQKALEQLFQTLLHDLMTAKIRVKDLEVPGDA